MRLQAEHLVMLMLVTYGAVECLDVICQIQLQLPIESALAKELRSCSVFIVNSVSFDIDQSTILSQEELARIDTIKRSNASADVLLTIVLPFNVTVQSVHRQLSERIGIVLRDNVLDGVDLDYDIALLDHYEQHRYGQFLRQLRTALSDKYRISTTIGCHTLGSSKALLTAFNDQLDLVSVVGVNMLEDELLNRSAEELLVREYEAEYIERLVSGGLRPEKIVLSVLTVGVVFNPGSYRAVRSLHRSLQVGVLAYGQVCELLRERQAKCGDGSKRPTCSLFAGRAAVVYDSETTVRLRTEQAHRLAARGVLILPNYDDTDNRCGAGPFPLFRSLME
ncbi:AGAP011977-PA, partial [Anopheles gambiae str. PEST]